MPAGVTVFGARSESTAEAIDEQVRILYQASENSGALPSSRTPSPDPPGSPSVAITLLSTPLLDVCNHYGADTAALAAYLHTIAVDVSTPLPSLGFAGTGGGGSNYLLIKASYRERDRTASFRCRAMRESRHTILLWAPSESRWYIVASQFVRGAESLTRQTQAANIRTENVKSSEAEDGFLDFEDSQRAVMKALVSTDPSTPLPSNGSVDGGGGGAAAAAVTSAQPGFLSFKTDGCLIGVSWYKIGSRVGNHLHAALSVACAAEAAAEAGAGGGADAGIDSNGMMVRFAMDNIEGAISQGWSHFPVFRSNQTAFIRKGMREWLCTAILADKSVCISPPRDLKEVESEVIPPFLAQSYALLGALPLPSAALGEGGAGYWRDAGGVISMSFEAVCPDRRTLWGSIQEGLAVSYARGRMQFLGMTSGSGTAWPSYTCHGAIADVVASVGLAQPACLRVQTAGEVNSAMDALSLVLQGKMSEADFFARADWTSSSGAGLNSAGRGGSGLLIDAEGFVLITSNGEYSKIKGCEYYLCHKFHPKKIAEVMALHPAAGHYFPLYTQLARALEPQSPGTPKLLGEVQRSVKKVAAVLHAGIVDGSSPILAAIRANAVQKHERAGLQFDSVVERATAADADESSGALHQLMKQVFGNRSVHTLFGAMVRDVTQTEMKLISAHECIDGIRRLLQRVVLEEIQARGEWPSGEKIDRLLEAKYSKCMSAKGMADAANHLAARKNANKKGKWAPTQEALAKVKEWEKAGMFSYHSVFDSLWRFSE